MTRGVPRLPPEARERLARFVRDSNRVREPDWAIVERRIGSPGSPVRWQRFTAERDRRYGEGKWSVGYYWEDRFIPEPEAIDRFYNVSYSRFLARNDDLVDSLCSMAADLTDSSAKLRGDPFLEVNAIKNALLELDRPLAGPILLDLGIQSGISDAMAAGRVPFMGGLNGWSLEQFWFGEHRCIGQLR